VSGADPIEKSHGRPHLARPRPSDLETVDTEAERRRNHGERGRFVAGNDAARNASAKRTLTRTLRQAVQETAGEALSSSDVVEVARDTLTLYGANKRSVGNGSPIVLARLLRNAVNDVLADRLTAAAIRAGIESKQGMALLEFAHKCEARAERAMVGALAAAKALGTKPPKPGAGGAPAGYEVVETEGEESDTP
jgi:hypothetical protein